MLWLTAGNPIQGRPWPMDKAHQGRNLKQSRFRIIQGVRVERFKTQDIIFYFRLKAKHIRLIIIAVDLLPQYVARQTKCKISY
jgi:hypothetical protein